MLINGYDEGPVGAGEELMALPGFLDGMPVCGAHHSPRCGIRLGQGITRRQNDKLARARDRVLSGPNTMLALP